MTVLGRSGKLISSWAVASLEEAERHQLWAERHRSRCDRGLPSRRGSSVVANL